MEKRYGHFDRKNNEYVINDPHTPMPWMNYLFNDEYYALISATAGGYSFHQSAKNKRILRYRLNNLPMDRPGRYIYIRDNKSNDYWSATWAPVQRDSKAENYECRHGFGYTKIKNCRNNIGSSVQYMVPLDDNLEIWQMTLVNRSKNTKNLSIFPYAEFSLWDAEQDLSNFQFTHHIVRCHADGNMINHTTWTQRMGLYAFFASSETPAAFDCDREQFIGAARSEADPQAVENGKCTNSVCSMGNAIAAFEIPVTLSPGEKKEIVFLLGTAKNQKAAQPLIKKYLVPDKADQVLNEIKSYWNDKISAQTVMTPDEDTNLCLNSWHPYQSQVTFRVSRGPSIYEGGIRRGMGYRDSCQDTLGVTHVERELVKKHLEALVKNQYSAGNSVHQFFKLTGKGQDGGHLDTHLWLIFAVTQYLKESGDFDFLSNELPFADNDSATVYEHLKRAVQFTENNIGIHGLPLVGFADWNDGFNGYGKDADGNLKGESVMIAMMLVKALRELREIAELLNIPAEINLFENKIESMVELINQHCWNGSWFTRAFHADENPLGTPDNKYGSIFLNAQTWAIMSQVADEKHGAQAMEAVNQYLNTEYGVKTLHPAFQEFDPRIGGVSDMQPGTKENGGIFCHTNPWAIIAETMLGNGDRAYEYYSKLRPTEYDKIQQIHEVEPYIYTQMIAGPEHSRYGCGRNSWLTGTVAWMYTAVTQYILGLRPTYKGLLIDPCIPSNWPEYSVKRRFRDGYVNVHVTNPDRVCKGIRKMQIDGMESLDHIVKPPSKDQTINVKVELGI
jgi:N,N'-diacetylchitobiose phosphorylase